MDSSGSSQMSMGPSESLTKWNDTQADWLCKLKQTLHEICSIVCADL